MYHVGKYDAGLASLPDGYENRCLGYTRVPLVDHNTGSVHMGLGICELAPGGTIDTHFHSYEEGFYILDGELILGREASSYRLGRDDYGVIQTGVSHSWRNDGASPVRWLNMLAPQPKPAGRGKDTWWEGGEAPTQASPPVLDDPRTRYLGHFSEDQLPEPSEIQMDGYRGGNISGISLKMLVDGFFGAQHLTMFIVQFVPGGGGNVHDHPFEESYFFLSGEAEGILDGEKHNVGPGSVVWSGVGGAHGFFTQGDHPARWLETQAPQPPTQGAFRFRRDWEEYLEGKG
ncbi:MAG: cupin domain-containing protein [Anaerolineales bacterium]|nr:cupin domain-containing protein [Anaerolineales bacterium]